MKKYIRITVLLLAAILTLAACGAQDSGYITITAEEAKNIMDTEQDYVILDVRTQEEFDEGHIPGAVLIPHTDIEAQAPAQLKDKEQRILVYCRSGNRSAQASEKLVQMGYTNVCDFGGIKDWPYDTELTPDYRPCNKPGNEKLIQE